MPSSKDRTEGHEGREAISILSKILAGPLSLVGEIYRERMRIRAEAKAQERQIQAALAERKIELIKQGLTADMNWEMEFARQASSSWKDEYTLIVVSIPAIMAFVPGWSRYAKAGLDALSAMPYWYQLLLLSIFFATYGIRYWRRGQTDT